MSEKEYTLRLLLDIYEGLEKEMKEVKYMSFHSFDEEEAYSKGIDFALTTITEYSTRVNRGDYK